MKKAATSPATHPRQAAVARGICLYPEQLSKLNRYPAAGMDGPFLPEPFTQDCAQVCEGRKSSTTKQTILFPPKWGVREGEGDFPQTISLPAMILMAIRHRRKKAPATKEGHATIVSLVTIASQ
ncbi:hypothetical protein ACOMHN_034328 [Nucella lapillus]